jgi:hypothetical protein
MDVIFGACAGYPAQKIRPFVVSLRRWYRGEVVLVSAHLPPDAKNLLNAHQINEIEIELDQPCSNIKFQRYFAYREILRARPDISRAMLVDVRDVFFQGDPFLLLSEGSLVAFLEDETIGNCVFNTQWLETIYGHDRTVELASHTISCSGTRGGTRAGLLHYLDLMCREITAAAPKQMLSGDQGIQSSTLQRIARGGLGAEPDRRGTDLTPSKGVHLRFIRAAVEHRSKNLSGGPPGRPLLSAFPALAQLAGRWRV